MDRQTIRKAKIVAARRDTSISGLLAQQIELLVGEEEAYERAESQALALLAEGFHLGGKGSVGRERLHERQNQFYAHDAGAQSKRATAKNILLVVRAYECP